MKLIDWQYLYGHYLNNLKVLISDGLGYLPLGRYFKNKLTDKENAVFIKKLYFEVTNICNARCNFCIYKNLSKKKEIGVMSFEIFKKAVDEFADLGGKTISFTPTVGEPLLDNELLRKISYAVNEVRLKRVYFYTNGTLLDYNEYYKKLVDSGLTVIDISTPGLDQQLYFDIYGIKNYHDVLRGIRKLLAYNKKKGEPLEINFNFRSTKYPSEVLNLPDFKNYIFPFLSEKVQYTFLVSYDNWAGNLKKEDLTRTMKLRQSFKKQKKPCLRTFDAIILYEGSVRLCACRIKDSEFDELVIGNIREKSLKEIYYGHKAKAIRRRFIDGYPPLVCKGCSLYDPRLF